VSPWVFAIAFAILVVGSAVQGVAGFGANLLAAPLLVLVDPSLVPGPLIVSAIALNLLILGTNRGDHPWRAMAWANVGQVVGSVCGAVVLGLIATESLAVFFAVMILIAVALGATGFAPRRTPATMGAAGATAGFMGTTVGIGGPAIALVHVGSEGAELRAALSRFFFLGTFVSLAALTAVGRFGPGDAVAGLLLIPGTVAGYGISRLFTDRVDRAMLRRVVLVLSAASAIAALIRAVG
jgi:uncharacterized membrane protein YfcA